MVVLMIRRTAIVMLALAGLGQSASTQPQQPQQQARRVIRISAERFSFTPSQIVIDAGEEVELRVKSDDTAHGFRIAGTHVNLIVPKRGRAEVSTTLRVTEPGRYAFECSRMCGAGHNFMRGELEVKEPK
jgi:cytochrome c oxidase subunit 2